MRPAIAGGFSPCAHACGRATGGDPPLTPEQDTILEIFAKTPLVRQFYFGGATALSAVHLHHRLSADLEFFRMREFDARVLAPFEKALKRAGFDMRRERRPPLFVYDLKAPGGARTRVDFAYYPYDRIDRGVRWRGVDVDSLIDMAVNKIQALVTRYEDKDLVDMYFLLKLRPELDLTKLVKQVGPKFDVSVHALTLAEKLLRAEEIRLMPRLLMPASKEEIARFLRDQARRLAAKPGS